MLFFVIIKMLQWYLARFTKKQKKKNKKKKKERKKYANNKIELANFQFSERSNSAIIHDCNFHCFGGFYKTFFFAEIQCLQVQRSAE